MRNIVDNIKTDLLKAGDGLPAVTMLSKEPLVNYQYCQKFFLKLEASS